MYVGLWFPFTRHGRLTTAQWYGAQGEVWTYIVRIVWPGNSPSNEPTADGWWSHLIRCIDEAREWDVLMFVSGEDEQACDALIEAGAELVTWEVLLVLPDA